jgi:hypothetical protein
LISTQDKATTRTRGGGALNLAWCSFALIWIATYTANLAQVMIVEQRSTEIASLDEMERRGLTACVKRGAAYARHMPELFPHIELVAIDPRFPEEAVAKLKDGACDAYVDSYSTLELIKGLPRHCDEDLVIPAQPLRFGDVDMAVGVRRCPRNPEKPRGFRTLEASISVGFQSIRLLLGPLIISARVLEI